MSRFHAFLGFLCLWALLANGCTRTDSTGELQDGWRVLGRSVVPGEVAGRAGALRPALDAPEATRVEVKGTIGEVCKAGCWFYLKDGEDMVYVDVAGEYAVPPTATGMRALVIGTTDGDGGSRILKATTVCLK